MSKDYIKSLATDKELTVTEQESIFQEALCNWELTKEKKYWDIMWLRVYECCRSIALRIAPGKPMVEERALDATIKIMDRIERLKKHPAKLSAYCYLPTLGEVQGPKAVKEDRESYFEDITEIEDILIEYE